MYDSMVFSISAEWYIHHYNLFLECFQFLKGNFTPLSSPPTLLSQPPILPSPRNPTISFLYLWISLFWTFHANEFVKSVVLCDWLFSLSIMISRFIHIALCFSTSFLFMAKKHSTVCFIYPFLSWWTLGCLHVGAFMKLMHSSTLIGTYSLLSTLVGSLCEDKWKPVSVE